MINLRWKASSSHPVLPPIHFVFHSNSKAFIHSLETFTWNSPRTHFHPGKPAQIAPQKSSEHNAKVAHFDFAANYAAATNTIIDNLADLRERNSAAAREQRTACCRNDLSPDKNSYVIIWIVFIASPLPLSTPPPPINSSRINKIVK